MGCLVGGDVAEMVVDFVVHIESVIAVLVAALTPMDAMPRATAAKLAAVASTGVAFVPGDGFD